MDILTDSSADAPATRTRALSPEIASPTLALAILLGVTGDLLIGTGAGGIGFPLWIALIAVSVVALAWRAELVVSREAATWLTVGVVCALGVAWRESEMLQFLNGVAALGCLVLGAAAIHRPGSVILAPRLRETAKAVFDVCRDTAVGILPLAIREAPLLSRAASLRGRVAHFTRASALALVIIAVFGSLLVGADPILASFLSLPGIDGENIIQHTVFIVAFTVLIGGWARAALLAKPIEPPTKLAGVLQLDVVEVTAALGALNVLFAASLLAQAGWVFGGEEFLRSRTGLTVAEYARRGFFQMVWIVALVVPVLVATRAALVPGRALARRHTMLSVPILAMLAVMIVSAVLRMRLYVHYFGLSTDRLYPLAFMAWLTIVLAWLSVTVLRNWGRPFVAGAAVSALATLGALNVMSPDRVVARVNTARPAAATPLDIAYLSTLSGEAADYAVRAVLDAPVQPGIGVQAVVDIARRCDAAYRLLNRWGHLSSARVKLREHGWRRWNSGEVAALRVVAARAAELRAMTGQCRRTRVASAPTPPAASTAPTRP